MTTRTPTRRAALVVATATAALVLTACGGDNTADGGHTGHGASPSTSAAATGTHNAQDVAFAQGMIPHHQQAVEMARLAADRASSAQVKDLAARIEKAQGPEITTMTGWLKSWGEDVPMAGMDHSGQSSMPGMDHSGMPGMDDAGRSGTAGMMSADDMDALRKASGKDFDTMFLTMMVDHHKGAVEMAGTEKAKGAYGPATSTADAVVTGQNAEIKEMQGLLGKG
ncbi:DUF305 domain-containing protein [Streptomyces sp. NPDC001984]|uniref:DUF305 domain-containing protein n=1 Tax=Streptomyces sp. NPDC002619 TaxID=3364655 RepID=UPI0036CB5EE6